MSTILGNRIKQLRISRGLTQRDLANFLNISNTTLSQYESGKRQPSNQVLLKLGEYFNVSVGYLLGSEKEQSAFSTQVSSPENSDIEDILAKLEEADGLMLYGSPLSDEARASIVAAMKLGMEAAKAKNKEKFTPKKYRKG